VVVWGWGWRGSHLREDLVRLYLGDVGVAGGELVVGVALGDADGDGAREVGQVEHDLGASNSARVIEAIEAIETIETIETIEAIETIETIEEIEAIEAIETNRAEIASKSTGAIETIETESRNRRARRGCCCACSVRTHREGSSQAG
jgi:hypothetical protein